MFACFQTQTLNQIPIRLLLLDVGDHAGDQTQTQTLNPNPLPIRLLLLDVGDHAAVRLAVDHRPAPVGCVAGSCPVVLQGIRRGAAGGWRRRGVPLRQLPIPIAPGLHCSHPLPCQPAGCRRLTGRGLTPLAAARVPLRRLRLDDGAACDDAGLAACAEFSSLTSLRCVFRGVCLPTCSWLLPSRVSSSACDDAGLTATPAPDAGSGKLHEPQVGFHFLRCGRLNSPFPSVCWVSPNHTSLRARVWNTLVSVPLASISTYALDEHVTVLSDA